MVVDYPYFTVKRFFNSLENAMAARPKDISLMNRVVAIRIFPLLSYANDSRYACDIDNAITIPTRDSTTQSSVSVSVW